MQVDIIKRAEELEDYYILQALLSDLRKTGESRFFNFMVKCLEAIAALDPEIFSYFPSASPWLNY